VRLTTALLVAGVARVALGLAFLLASVLAGADGRAALTGFSAGTFLLAVVALYDPRRRFVRGRKPVRRPAGSVLAPVPTVLLTVIFPSTVVVSVLAIVSLVLGNPILVAVLAGALAGIGVAAFVSYARVALAERRQGEEFVRILAG
jgi:hypothetical protein